MGFTRTKDRVWTGYNVFAHWLAHRSRPVRKAGYGVFGGVLRIAYRLPGSKVRATIEALAEQVGHDDPNRLFRDFVTGFTRGIDRIEQVRHGRTDAIDAMLLIPEQDKLDALLARGGVVLAIPHTHASLAMGRGLARKYPILALVRSTVNERRAASEREIYDHLGCEWLDIRLDPPTLVARKVLGALSKGRLVVGTVDRIQKAPPAEDPVHARSDHVRVTAFGQPVGITGWPARFTAKTGATILPATVVQDADTISLILGDPVTPTDDIVATSQAWTDSLVALFRKHPEEWVFALDKFWSRALRASVGKD